ncbi:MAG: acyltransferase [Acidiferrobacter sp.]
MMRYEMKVVAVIATHLLSWPLALPSRAAYRLLGSERMFESSAKFLSLFPGRVGQLLRASFYMQTLAQSHYDLAVGFGSFFAHPSARVGRGVGVGSFSIIGTADIGDNVMVASRVSILSGKYQHGGGHRGRSIKANPLALKGIHIGEGSWLGEGCLVMADIGARCIVSAGSVVTKPAPEASTAIGNPARFVRYMDNCEAAGM